ncbi:PREDICTED: uncharacterized protein LOC105556529 [Vollenhovia emeryi]|uniref:uncharacterized protein LOC105556529 n=1 Tax=Vollenhovia emeryi TaxID=411798 RepID=UPI0005F51801|nr:PREDICTED: uncharacterized protein LOC105556529 [Vollenhovia emeryi]
MSIDTLRRQRIYLKGKLTQIKNFINKVNKDANATPEEVTARLQAAEEIYAKSQNISQQLFILEDESDSRDEVEDAEFDDRYYSIKAELLQLLKRFKPPPAGPSDSGASSVTDDTTMGNELWVLEVSEAEFLAASAGNEEVLKHLIDRENQKRNMELINKEANKPEKSVDVASEINESKKDSFIWPDQAVLLFLDIYRNKEPEFASGLKRHNKIWADIANELKEANYNVTAAQCQNKMSGLKRTYKNISDSNKKSGNFASSWAFYSAMDSIFGKKAWLEPVSTASSDGPYSPGSSVPEKSGSSEKFTEDGIMRPSKKRRVESILESYITEIKEDKQKERRDKEQRRVERIERQNQVFN